MKEEMTANKIADELEEWASPRTVEHAVAMLRKQQAEIEKLKLRELTDDEILDTAKTMPTIDGATMEEAYILFARAILRKASEK
jgi:hypothetical protein